jgi:sugar lactone lactonase YvrE
MNQPNDLAISPDGALWASDPNWSKGIAACGETPSFAQNLKLLFESYLP